jgi:hypothetical protein
MKRESKMEGRKKKMPKPVKDKNRVEEEKSLCHEYTDMLQLFLCHFIR